MTPGWEPEAPRIAGGITVDGMCPPPLSRGKARAFYPSGLHQFPDTAMRQSIFSVRA